MSVITAYGVQCFLLVVGGSGAEQKAMRPEEFRRATSLFLYNKQFSGI